MRINIHDVLKFAVLTLCVGGTLTVRATGFRLPDQDAFATGRGEAFVATADNPSAIYYNPAGISQLEGNNFRAGVYAIDLDPKYQNPTTGDRSENQLKYHALPQLYYTVTPKDWIASFGLGFYTPFGLGVIWPQDTGFNTIATEGKLFTETINPVVSFKLLPTLSFGGGIMVNYSSIKLQQGIAPIPPAPQGSTMFSFDGDGWNVGFNLGALWQPIQQLSFGATVRSGTTMNFKGQTETILPPFYPGTSPNFSSANSKWSFPLDVAGGVSYRPTEKWNLEFDADYTDWGTLGTVNLNQSSPPFFMPPTTPIPLNWASSWYFEWGATRYLAHGWHVNAGYIFNQNSVPNPNYTPFVADMNRHFFSVGLGRKGKNFDFDIAYQFGYGPTHTVTGSAVDLAGQSADGNYSFISHAISASVGWHF